MSDSSRYTVAEASAQMAAGKLTAVRLAEDCLARVSQRESTVQAWTFLDPQLVLAQAAACDREPRRSALHGIPVGIKDIIDTADMPTGYGSPIYDGHRPRADAACVAMLRNAGAVIMGKAVTVEFAMRHPGKTRNPHNPEHTPGGSSSGSAAAVADFMVPLALGTQTGGSVIRPAAFCGVVGFKPTFNAINRAGVKPNAESLDTVGIMGRTAADVKLAYTMLTGGAGAAQTGGVPRIGWCRTPQWNRALPETAAAFEGAVAALGRSGMAAGEVVLPALFDRMVEAHGCISDYESCRALSYEIRNFPDKISDTLRPKLDKAARRTLADYLAARQVATDCRRALREVFSRYDALLVPSAPGEAPRGLKSTGDSIFNRMWTALHVPAVTVPVVKGPSGLPVGLQLVGAFGSDHVVLDCAEQVHLLLKQ